MEKLYTKQHEWILIDDDVATIGITDFAQSQLGDVVFVELPQIGDKFDMNQEMAVVESVKAASEVYMPIDGEVVQINENLESEPDLINTSAEDSGWFVKVRVGSAEQLSQLMSEQDYKKFIDA